MAGEKSDRCFCRVNLGGSQVAEWKYMQFCRPPPWEGDEAEGQGHVRGTPQVFQL